MIARYILLFLIVLLSGPRLYGQIDSKFPVHEGTLSEANQKTLNEDLDFYVILYDDTSNAAYKSLWTVINDSSVVQSLQDRVLLLHEDVRSANGQSLVKQFDVDELPAAFFVSKEGEKLRDINYRFESDQFLESYSRYVRRLP